MEFKTTAIQGQTSLPDEIEEARNSWLNSARQQQFDAVLNMARSHLSGNLPSLNLPPIPDSPPGSLLQPSALPWDLGSSPMGAPMSGLEGLAASVFLQAMAHSSGGMALHAYEMAGRLASIPGREMPAESMAVSPKPQLDIPSRWRERSPAIPRGEDSDRLGALSAQFESADAGAGAIGYDRNGGTSYGIFQISSRQGTIKLFLDFLDRHAPQWAARLKSAGPSDTGSAQGGMPREWSRIAQEDPVSFEKLQEDFIRESHYDAALAEIQQKTGLDVSKHSSVLQQVVWSTAVQHGPHGAANVLDEAVQRIQSSGKEMTDKQLIENVYAVRATKFGLSNPQVRAAVQARFTHEKGMALAMLGGGRSEAQG